MRLGEAFFFSSGLAVNALWHGPDIEARRGLGEARRGLGEATPRTQNVLAQGQSEAHGDSKLYNTIVEVPGRLNLK